MIAEEEYWFRTQPELLSAGPDFAKQAKLTHGQLVPLKDRIVFVRGTAEVTTGICVVEVYRHTPGHMVHVESGGSGC